MTVPFTFATATGNVPLAELDANFASVANNVSSANIALIAGTVTANAQPNITSVGTLTGLSVAGTVTANLIVGNIAGSITNALYAATAGIVTTPSQLNITQVGVLSSLSTSGNIRSGFLNVTGAISATGNIIGSFIGAANGNIGVPAGVTTMRIGNISPTTIWIGGDASNIYLANVDSVTAVAGNLTVGADIGATGNITGNYFIGNGSLLTGIANGVSSYGNTNVANFLSNYGSNTISTTGNIITAGNVQANRLIGGEIYSGGLITSNGPVFVTGQVSATGNVVAAFISSAGGNIGVPVGTLTMRLGNETPTTIWIGGDASNIYMANVNSTTRVAGNLATGGVISATGNITGNNISTTTAFRLPVYANTTARNAAISSPAIGMLVVVGNTYQGYNGSSWGNITLT
jgi:hypothetical protein